jgi:hypothetical protein
MARGNQRDKAREKNEKAKAAQGTKVRPLLTHLTHLVARLARKGEEGEENARGNVGLPRRVPFRPDPFLPSPPFWSGKGCSWRTSRIQEVRMLTDPLPSCSADDWQSSGSTRGVGVPSFSFPSPFFLCIAAVSSYSLEWWNVQPSAGRLADLRLLLYRPSQRCRCASSQGRGKRSLFLPSPSNSQPSLPTPPRRSSIHPCPFFVPSSDLGKEQSCRRRSPPSRSQVIYQAQVDGRPTCPPRPSQPSFT